MHPKKIIIIGGGIGGAATALALDRVKFKTALYERTTTLREVGAGLALWANATHVLKKLDVLEDVLSEGDRVTNYQFFSQSGKELMNLRVDGFEVPAVTIHRADLQALLWRKIPLQQTVLGESFDRFEQHKDKVIAYFTSNITDEGDALIGADGLRSRVRMQLFGDAKPIYRGMTAYRGLTDYIPNTYKPGYICEFLGAGKGFGFVTIGKGRMYWYAAVKAPEGQPDASRGRKKELQEMFQDWAMPIPELIASTDEANIIKTELCDRPSLKAWSLANVTLLGDAAHPMLPTMGQGACMAIEDALVVANCLLEHSHIADSFRQYESLRLLRTKKIVEQSLQIGKVASIENRVFVGVRNTLMKLLARQFQKDYQLLHAYRV
jgi:2-polyprenyl-6-methoxyphenol hydroxylase-like FAD-dependent oxidoreductase